MRCKKFGTLLKYMDGGLSERRARLVERHIRNCPDCAAETKSLEEIRSFLRAAGKIEMPDEYWDTYWSRLEKKLPDEPSPAPLIWRISEAIVPLLRKPAVLGRAAIYIFLLAFLIYMTSDHPTKFTPRSTTLAQAHPETAAAETYETSSGLQDGALGRDEAEDGVFLGRRQARLRARTPAPRKPKGGSSDRTVEYAARDKLVPSFLDTEGRVEETKKGTKLARPVTAPEEDLAEPQDTPQGVAGSADEYVVADNHFKKGEYRLAIPAYQNFVKANVHDDRTLEATYQIGEAYYQLGKYPEALSNFVAVTNAGESEGLGVRRTDKQDGYSYQGGYKEEMMAPRAGKRESEGARERKSGRAGEPGSENARTELISRAIFRLAESHEHLGRRVEALAAYKKYVEKYPQGKYLSQAKEKIAQITR